LGIRLRGKTKFSRVTAQILPAGLTTQSHNCKVGYPRPRQNRGHGYPLPVDLTSRSYLTVPSRTNLFGVRMLLPEFPDGAGAGAGGGGT